MTWKIQNGNPFQRIEKRKYLLTKSIQDLPWNKQSFVTLGMYFGGNGQQRNLFYTGEIYEVCVYEYTTHVDRRFRSLSR
jgi:hypothetical protein